MADSKLSIQNIDDATAEEDRSRVRVLNAKSFLSAGVGETLTSLRCRFLDGILK